MTATAGGTCHADARSLNAYFGATHAVRDVSLDFPSNEVTAIIGPSGCGKSTLLRCLNRMHETIPLARVEGEVLFRRTGHLRADVDPIALRRHVGMVFQRPTPFPTMSIRDNVAAGLRVQPGRAARSAPRSTTIVERALRAGGAVGRGEGSAQDERDGHLRRPAAAAVHRARARDGAARAAARRADGVARSAQHAEGRGAGVRAAASR